MSVGLTMVLGVIVEICTDGEAAPLRELTFSLSRHFRLSSRLNLGVGVSALNIRFSFAPHVNISGATPEAE